MTLTERIQQLKEKHGSIRAAARALKVDHAYLYRLYTGEKTEPSAATLRKLGIRRYVFVTYRRSSTTDQRR